jgi:hypothetical protein
MMHHSRHINPGITQHVFIPECCMLSEEAANTPFILLSSREKVLAIMIFHETITYYLHERISYYFHEVISCYFLREFYFNKILLL